MINCTDGGCLRCKKRATYASSVGCDVCICVHAEQNALISAARFGNAIQDSVVYSTLRPCSDCTKSLVQAKAAAIYYMHNWLHPLAELREQYELLQNALPEGVHQVLMDDPEEEWASGK